MFLFVVCVTLRIFSMKPVFDFYNHQLAGEIETVYLHSRPEHVYISSSAVRELLKFEQDISKYVPNVVLGGVKRNEEKKLDGPYI